MDGWEPLMCGWEPKSSQHLLVTQLRGYAVTHMLLYDQLYPKKSGEIINFSLIWVRFWSQKHVYSLFVTCWYFWNLGILRLFRFKKWFHAIHYQKLVSKCKNQPSKPVLNLFLKLSTSKNSNLKQKKSII